MIPMTTILLFLKNLQPFSKLPLPKWSLQSALIQTLLTWTFGAEFQQNSKEFGYMRTKRAKLRR